MRSCNLRLSLDRHAAVKRNWVERLGEAILHVVLEINAAGRADTVVVIIGVAKVGRGCAGEAMVAVRGYTRH